MAENNIRGVIVQIFGEEYQIAESDAAKMSRIAEYVDGKMREIAAQHGGRIPTAKLAVAAAMTITDELFKTLDHQTRLAETAQEHLRLTQQAVERADAISSRLDLAVAQPVREQDHSAVQ